MKGININCKHNNYIDQILSGDKVVETRDSNSLHHYIGERVGLIETGKGTAFLRGFATIVGCYKYYTEKEFENHEYLHRIYPGDEHYWNKDTECKFGYIFDDVEECEPRFIYTRGYVARTI